MKKLFSFRSSGFGNGSNKDLPTLPIQQESYWENPSEGGRNSQVGDVAGNNSRSSKGLFSRSRKQVSDIQDSSRSPMLQRCRSTSSADFLGDVSSPRSPSSIRSGDPHKQSNNSFRSRTPERIKHFEVPYSQNLHGVGRPASGCSSRTHRNLSGTSSSTCSSNLSGKVLDRYIDGEQEQNKSRSNISHGNFAGTRSCMRPPRAHYTSPSSPADNSDKTRAHSFKDSKSSGLRFSPRDWGEAGFSHESPRQLAKNVVERLSRSRVLPKPSQKELDRDLPVTLEDIYGGSMNRCFNANPDAVSQRSYSSDGLYGKYDGEDFQGLQKPSSGDYCEDFHSNESENEQDFELHRRSKQAEERVLLLSREVEKESFFRDTGFDVPALIQIIRKLAEERLSLALEVSGRLRSHIADRAAAKDEQLSSYTEWKSNMQRLEKEKIEIQSALEKELDRRSSEWSSKLEKYQSEEQRLRERVRELAERNVSLQREVSLINERDSETKVKVTFLEQQVKDLGKRFEDTNKENLDLHHSLSELQENYRAAEEERACVQNNFEIKENECKELHRSVTRLLRTCSEQDKTIAGLREAFHEDQSDKQVSKLQTEQMRLTGVEMALRRELESFKVEVDSLRHENIGLLNRLKGNGKETDVLNLRFDKEMRTRVCCLQNQGLSMLTESAQLSSRLLEYIKAKSSGSEVTKNGLDGHFVIDSEMKAQGLKRGIENLTRSLQKISALLDDNSSLSTSICQSNGPVLSNSLTSEDAVKYELKAETLLTSLLREKLYSKEREVEQLQAELATTVRGADILQCEVQNAKDNFSFASHKSKDLEIQMLKKEESLKRVENELRECKEDLTELRGILPQISAERDLMWNEVKQYSEKNMLLNSEMGALRNKLEALEEEILLKEGQMTILKDSMVSHDAFLI